MDKQTNGMKLINKSPFQPFSAQASNLCYFADLPGKYSKLAGRRGEAVSDGLHGPGANPSLRHCSRRHHHLSGAHHVGRHYEDRKYEHTYRFYVNRDCVVYLLCPMPAIRDILSRNM